MAFINDYAYYANSGAVPEDKNWGSYQYVSLDEIVNNFTLMYQGNNSIINNVDRYQILFHAKRGVQELNYDAMKEIKILQMDLGDELKLILPSDYINWVRISEFRSGVLYPLTENIQTGWANTYLQDQAGKIIYDQNGNVLRPQDSELDVSFRNNTKSIYLNTNSPYNNQEGYNVNGSWYFDYAVGARFGLNTETANQNQTFSIDKARGVINFSSASPDMNIVIEYVSDGMEKGVDANISVNKLFEEFIYAYITYSILNSKMGVQEYIINRARKDKSSLLRNAKIRLSNIHPGRLLMSMRGKDKWLK
jgi:hypothetical protein